MVRVFVFLYLDGLSTVSHQMFSEELAERTNVKNLNADSD